MTEEETFLTHRQADDPDVAWALAEIARLREEVAQLKSRLATLKLDRDSWRGEVRNILYTRPRALGARSIDIIEELVEELAAKEEA